MICYCFTIFNKMSKLADVKTASGADMHERLCKFFANFC